MRPMTLSGTRAGRRTRSLLPLVLVLGLGLGACSSDDGEAPGGSSGPTTSATADASTPGGDEGTSGTEDSPVTRETLPQVLESLTDDVTGAMSLRVAGTVPAGLPLFLRSRAVWDFDADAASLSIVRAAGTSDVPRATLLQVGTDLYAGKPAPGTGPDCWNLVDSVDPDEIGDSGVPGRIPAVEAVLRFAADRDGAAQRTDGTTAAAPVLRMIGLTAAGDQVAPDATIPVRLDESDGRVRRLVVRPGDVVRVLQDVPGTEAADLARALTRSRIRSWTASFAGFGDPADLSRPSRAELRAGRTPACA